MPHDVARLVERLAGAGLAPTSERASGSVNQVMECRSPTFAVRLTGDRGQWWVDGGLPGGTQWYDADIWGSCLTGAAPAGPGSLDEQVDYFVSQHDALALAAAREDTWDCLRRQRQRRTRERLGLPPSDG